MAFCFPKGTNWVDMPEPLTVILYDPRTASANRNSSRWSYVEQNFRAPVEVPGKADEIIRQASVCTFVSFLTRYFLLRPPAQDTHAFDMVGISQLCISISS